MQTNSLQEVWLRGPLPGVPPLLQPAAHAMLQSREEIGRALADFPEDQLWSPVAGMASVGFHLQHITGFIDRLFSYARNEQLNAGQLSYLASEGSARPGAGITDLLQDLDMRLAQAMRQIRETPEQELQQFRGVGPKQLPSTVIGLVFHAAEHFSRHTGQLLVTTAVLKSRITRAV